MKGVYKMLDVILERDRQIKEEGWTPEHDDRYKRFELSMAASCYARHCDENHEFKDQVPDGWPWDEEWWKPTSPRRDLIKAAALIIAEIERLDRLPHPQSGD